MSDQEVEPVHPPPSRASRGSQAVRKRVGHALGDVCHIVKEDFSATAGCVLGWVEKVVSGAVRVGMGW